MRCLTPFLGIAVFAVLALAGYNYTQINQLKSQLDGVRAQVRKSEVSTSDKRDLVESLTQVKLHTARARQMLAKGHTARAQVELDKSLNALDKASDMSRSMSESNNSEVSATWSAVRKEVDRAWKEVSRQIQEQKPEGSSLRSK